MQPTAGNRPNPRGRSPRSAKKSDFSSPPCASSRASRSRRTCARWTRPASSARTSDPPVLRAGPDGDRDPGGVRRAGRAPSSSAVLAVEELSAVDPSAGRHRGRPEHARATTRCCAGRTRSRSAATCRGWPRTRWAPTRSPKPARARTPSPSATRAVDEGDHFLLNGRKLWITNAAEAGFSCCSPMPTRRRATGHHRVPGGARLPRLPGGQEGGQARASAPPPPAS